MLFCLRIWCSWSKDGNRGGDATRRSSEAGAGVLHTNDACVASKSIDGMAKVMAAIVEVIGKFKLTASGKKPDTLLMRVKPKKEGPPQPIPLPLIVEAVGYRYDSPTTDFQYMGGHVNEDGELATAGAEQRRVLQEVLPRALWQIESTV